MKTNELLKLLKKNNCKEIKTGTANSILKDAGIEL